MKYLSCMLMVAGMHASILDSFKEVIQMYIYCIDLCDAPSFNRAQ